MGRPTGCASHRPALTAFAERSERGPGTDAALEHLEVCRRCQADLTGVLLTIHAVRRTLDGSGTMDPSADAWDRLRVRVQRPVANAWAARTSLAGVVVGAGLVAALVGPATVISPGRADGREPGPDPAALYASTIADQRAEFEFLTRPRTERLPVRPVTSDTARTAAWSGPDGLGRPEPRVRVDAPTERVD